MEHQDITIKQILNTLHLEKDLRKEYKEKIKENKNDYKEGKIDKSQYDRNITEINKNLNIELEKLQNEKNSRIPYLKENARKVNTEKTKVINELNTKKIELKKKQQEILQEKIKETNERIKKLSENTELTKKELAEKRKEIKLEVSKLKLKNRQEVEAINKEIRLNKQTIKEAEDKAYLATLKLNSPKNRAISSAFVWGSGQIKNRQLFKGLVFLFFQISLILTEILSGKYVQYFIFGNKKSLFLYDYFLYKNEELKFNIRDTGIFIRGIWGLITAGTRGFETGTGYEIWSLPGDNSPILIITGLIALLMLLVFLGIYVYNIKDAKKTCELHIRSAKVASTLVYLRQMWEGAFHYIVILPAIILMSFFSLMPIFFGLLVAFTNYNGRHLNFFDWVGFANFAKLANFGSGQQAWGTTFVNLAWWTILFAVLATGTCFFGGLFQAVILNNKRVVGRKIWRTIIILPWAIPGLVLLLIIRNAFNTDLGLINNYFRDWGVLELADFFNLTNATGKIGWFSDSARPWLARGTVILVNLFVGLPYYMALMTGVMTSIDKSLYQAAEIDGASPRQQFWKITLPLVLYMTAPLLIMSFAFNLNNFGIIYFLTGGGPTNNDWAYAGHTDILISWIYQLTTKQPLYLYNMASVFSIIIFVIVGSFSAYNFTRTRAFREEDMV